mmetsp:Transcript_25301/g.69871  ORF Transcript_25301/g.69871 Transcript_25301/m.69871 type:complete len:422 (+) Transcript_25301:41-1306(+)
MEETIFMWRQGIHLWEAGAYLEAMDAWEGAPLVVEALSASTSNTKDADEEPHHTNLLPKKHTRQTVPDIAPLLLFLAGCFLDAGNYSKARQYCRAAWAFALAGVQGPNDEAKDLLCENLNHRILCEYMAAWEEDTNMSSPWKVSLRIVEEAFAQQKECQQREDEGQETLWRIPILWSGPHQRPAFYYPIRKDPPYHSLPVCPTDLHPAWCKLMEQDYSIILEEFLQLCRGNGDDNGESVSFPHHWPVVGGGAHRQGAGSHDGSVVNSRGDWRELVLFGSGAISREAPRTRDWIRKHAPDVVELAEQGGGEVIFSVLAPHTRISPHCASTNLRWTAHLGLLTPQDAKIRIADSLHQWHEGKVLVFDDSFEHEVSTGNEMRAVLLLRFFHPNLQSTRERSLAIQKALEWKQVEDSRRYHPPLV